MDIDASLMEIFLEETGIYLQILQDPQASRESKGNAAHGLKGIAAMLGFESMSIVAAKLEHEFRSSGEPDTEFELNEIILIVQKIKDSREPDGSFRDFVKKKPTDRESSEKPLTTAPQETTTPKVKKPLAADVKTPVIRRVPSPATLKIKPLAVPAPKETSAQHPLPETAASSKTVSASRPKISKDAAGKESEWDDETAAILRSIFQEEAREHIDGMERSLETLKKDLNNTGAVNELFRYAHTMKGAAATVGLNSISNAAHRLEDNFEKIRSGSKHLTSAELNHCLHGVEILNKMVSEYSDDETLKKWNLELDKALTGVPEKAHKKKKKTSDKLEKKSADQAVYEPAENLRKDDRRLSGRRDEDRRIIRIPVERVDALMESVGELVFARTRIQRRTEELAGLLKDISLSHRGLRTTLVGIGLRSLDHALLQRFSEVEVEFADEVSNLERAMANLSGETDWLRRIAATIQEGLISLRMMSISYLMARLKRSARETARELSKDISIELEGEDTELDKTVAERLAEPLIHLVRNAVGHGIESAAERRSANKPVEGRVRIAAHTEGEYVLIEISDDGKGIDLRKIRSQVLKKGLMPKRQLQKLSNEKAMELIFLPGFTTRDSVDSVSGRGVGLDSVRESISALSGEINVTSEKGKGTSFFLRLPLLTTITNALLFKAGGEVYALPLTHVEETLLLDEKEVDKAKTRDRTIDVRGEKIRLVDLHELLGVEKKAKSNHIHAICGRWSSQRFALICDKIVGPREIVVKPLGGLLAPLPHYCGATISGAGKVQLVLDAATLARSVGSSALYYKRGFIEDQRKGPRVLLCDDSRSIREVVSRILLHAGYDVEKANDGWDAWERMHGTRVDLLLTDLEMPRLDGYGLIEKVRREEKFSGLPIVVLTSRTGEANRRKAEHAGADRFVTKPVNKRIILKQIDDLLTPQKNHNQETN